MAPPRKKRRGRRRGSGTIEALRIGTHYQTTYGTLWKDGTYFPRGTRVIDGGRFLGRAGHGKYQPRGLSTYLR